MGLDPPRRPPATGKSDDADGGKPRDTLEWWIEPFGDRSAWDDPPPEEPLALVSKRQTKAPRDWPPLVPRRDTIPLSKREPAVEEAVEPFPLVRKLGQGGRPSISIPPSSPKPQGVFTLSRPAADHAAPPPSSRRAPPAPVVPAPVPVDEATMLERAMQGVRDAATRDAVIARLMEALELFAKRVAVFAVRRRAFEGWACTSAFADSGRFRDVRVDATVPSVLATAVALGDYLGPIPATEGHAPLSSVMKGSKSDVLVLPVLASGIPALVVLVDEPLLPLETRKRAIAIANAAGDALSTIVKVRRDSIRP